MIAATRPDIARVAEESVLNLKGLESTLETLRNDLAYLCQSIGHTEAARLALTPIRSSTPWAVPHAGFSASLPSLTPGASPIGFGVANPWTQQALAQQQALVQQLLAQQALAAQVPYLGAPNIGLNAPSFAGISGFAGLPAYGAIPTGYVPGVSIPVTQYR